MIKSVSCAALLAVLLPAAASAQIVTPRSRTAPVYQQADMESTIVGEIEPDGRWQLDFSGAELPAKMSEDPGTSLKFLLPGRDNGTYVFARVRGRGKRDQGWVLPEKIEVSPDAGWKIPRTTLVFAPMRARQVPPVRTVPHFAERPAKAASYLLLITPEGNVAGVRPLDGADANPALESALQQMRFAPLRFEGEPVHVLLAIKVEGK